MDVVPTWALVVGAGIGFGIAFMPWKWTGLAKRALVSHWQSFVWGGTALAFLVGSGWGVVWLVSEIDFSLPTRPEYEWSHPTLTAAEQEKAESECEIAAYETFGGGSGKIGDRTPRHRANYVTHCLIVKGFVREETPDDGPDGAGQE